jgi:hypothetical protein
MSATSLGGEKPSDPNRLAAKLERFRIKVAHQSQIVNFALIVITRLAILLGDGALLSGAVSPLGGSRS